MQLKKLIASQLIVVKEQCATEETYSTQFVSSD